MNGDFPERLRARLQSNLPGRAAQRLFEPDLSYGRHFGPPTAHSRAAAVLVLLYPAQHGWHLPLTVRPATMATHAGQISLPGGMIEPGETPDQAALRELAEELGVTAGEVDVLGQLSPLYLFASDFMVNPWVAAAARRPAWVINPTEVAELLEVPLVHLFDPANAGRHARRHRGIDFTAPHFLWGRHRIWGATSMILSELRELGKEEGGRRKEE
ncbi:MAG: CoA pyrophosphatase [Pirellulales bacterium]